METECLILAVPLMKIGLKVMMKLVVLDIEVVGIIRSEPVIPILILIHPSDIDIMEPGRGDRAIFHTVIALADQPNNSMISLGEMSISSQDLKSKLFKESK